MPSRRSLHPSTDLPRESKLPSGSREVAGRGGDWPRTTRVLPWLVAMSIVGIYLLPVDAAELAIGLPFDLKLDRVLLAPTFAIWLATVIGGGPYRPRFPALGSIGYAVWAWVAIIAISVALNAPNIVAESQGAAVLKRVLLIAGYLSFFVMVVSVVRRQEVRPLITLWIGAATVLALDALIAYKTQQNLLLNATAAVLPPPFVVLQPDASSATGATLPGFAGSGLALTTMLTLAFAFALNRALAIPWSWRRAGLVVVLLVIATGAVVTARKSALVMPAIVVVGMLVYRPRATLRFWPVALAFVVFAQIAAPAALTTIVARSGDQTAQNSNRDRASDYPATLPDILARPVFGDGFGTYDPLRYRFLDNQLLATTIETGFAGLIALLAIVGTAVWTAHRIRRRPAASDAIGGAIGLLAFAAALVLFDALGFVQTFYLMLLLIAFVAVLADDSPERGVSSP